MVRNLAFAPLFMLLSGFLSGFCNGFFGTGGGTVLLLLLALSDSLTGSDGKEENASARFFTCLCVMLPLSVFSFSRYLEKGGEEFLSVLPSFSSFLLPAAIGGVLGSLLLRRLQSNKLQILFAVLVIISGTLLIVCR